MAQKGQAATDPGDVDQEEPPGDAEPATPVAVAPEPRVGESGAAGRLLLVDDEPAVRVVCTDLLELSGFDVVSVGSGAEAEARFAAEPGAFDVVVTDHNMPSMTGTELAERLARLRADVPVVLTTGFSESEVAAGEGETAVTAVVTKPYAVEELLEAIARARSARG
jgi:CheY-like chemotaxis protein